MKALVLSLAFLFSFAAFGADDFLALLNESDRELSECKKWEKAWVDVSNPMIEATPAEKKQNVERLLKQFKSYPGPNRAGRKAWALVLQQAKSKPEKVEGELSSQIRGCAEPSFATMMKNIVERPKAWNFSAVQKKQITQLALRFIADASAGPGDNYNLGIPIALFRILANRKAVLLEAKQEKELTSVEEAYRESTKQSMLEAQKANLPNAGSRSLSSEENKKAVSIFVGNVKRLEAIRVRFAKLVAPVSAQ